MEYGLNVHLQEETNKESGEMAELDEEGAETLFQYISGSLEDGTEEGDSDVAFTPELEEPVDDPGTGGTHSVSLEGVPSGEYADFNRVVSFSYELEQGAEKIAPDTIGMDQLGAFSAGMPGFKWEEIHTSAHYHEETGEVEFYTSGEWDIHFLYKGTEVQFSVSDDWFAPLDPEEIFEDLPVVW
jgi:hypothetical protein